MRLHLNEGQHSGFAPFDYTETVLQNETEPWSVISTAGPYSILIRNDFEFARTYFVTYGMAAPIPLSASDQPSDDSQSGQNIGLIVGLSIGIPSLLLSIGLVVWVIKTRGFRRQHDMSAELMQRQNSNLNAPQSF
jgi:hypothetical protein